MLLEVVHIITTQIAETAVAESSLSSEDKVKMNHAMLHDPATAAKFYVKRDYKTKSDEEDRLWQKVLKENGGEESSIDTGEQHGVDAEQEEEAECSLGIDAASSITSTAPTMIASHSTALRGGIDGVGSGEHTCGVGATRSLRDKYPTALSNRTITYTATQANYVPLPGDWGCTSCGNVNFAFRQECRRCHAAKSQPKSVSPSPSNFARTTAPHATIRPQPTAPANNRSQARAPTTDITKSPVSERKRKREKHKKRAVIRVTKRAMHDEKGEVFKAVLSDGTTKWLSKKHISDELIKKMKNNK